MAEPEPDWAEVFRDGFSFEKALEAAFIEEVGYIGDGLPYVYNDQVPLFEKLINENSHYLTMVAGTVSWRDDYPLYGQFSLLSGTKQTHSLFRRTCTIKRQRSMEDLVEDHRNDCRDHRYSRPSCLLDQPKASSASSQIPKEPQVRWQDIPQCRITKSQTRQIICRA